MLEVIFLAVLGAIWISFASMQDLKHTEVANWLSFSLIIFALGFRFFWSLFSASANGFSFFYQGLIGFGIFLVLGNFLYYVRMFAGGDAKLMIALGPVLGFSESFITNLKIYFIFLFLFLFVGMFYGMFWSFSLMFKNSKRFKREFPIVFKKNKKMVYSLSALGLIFLVFGFFESLFFILGFVTIFSSYLYVYAKTIDECCMVKKIKSENLREGDWLYKDVRVGKRVIKASWEGVGNKDIREIQKRYKMVVIREGIPFVPVFLIAFLILIYIWFAKVNLGFVF